MSRVFRLFGVSGRQEADETRESRGVLSRLLVGEMQERQRSGIQSWRVPILRLF